MPKTLTTGAPSPDHQPDAEAVEYMVAWHDFTLGADYWFSLGHIRPADAALLICGFNPHKVNARADAEQVEGDTKPQDFKRALGVFEDAQSVEPAPRRTLRDWIDLANKTGLRHARWIDEYPAASAPANAAVRREVSPGRLVSALGAGRSDLLTPLISAAAGELGDDPASVFALLRKWAGDKRPPLLGVTDRGVQWLTADDKPRELTLAAVRDRLRRLRLKGRGNAR